MDKHEFDLAVAAVGWCIVILGSVIVLTFAALFKMSSMCGSNEPHGMDVPNAKDGVFEIVEDRELASVAP